MSAFRHYYPCKDESRDSPQRHHHPHPHPPAMQPLHPTNNGPCACCSGAHTGHSYYTPYGYAAPPHDVFRRRRTTFTNDQLNILEDEYENDQYMDTFKRADLARRLGLHEAQIKVWFQNRRAKQKREGGGSLGEEDDYSPVMKSRPLRTMPLRSAGNRNRSLREKDSSSPKENQAPASSESFSQKELSKSHSPVPLQSDANLNAVPNNLAEYGAATPAPNWNNGHPSAQMAAAHRIIANSDAVTAGDFKIYAALKNYDVEELGTLCKQWADKNSKNPNEKVFTSL